MKIVQLDAYAANPGDISWDAWENITANGEKVEFIHYDLTDACDVIERAKDAEMVLVNKVIIDDKVMSQLPKLRYVGVLATGYNVVDTEAARKRGIVVTNIPAYSTMSVAQMVFAHLLNITNRVQLHSDAVSSGKWQNNKCFTFWETPQLELANLTIGIFGLGNTGTATARIALAMGMKVLAYSSKEEAEIRRILGVAENCSCVCKAESKEQFFASSDVISLHCPLTPATHHIINKETISMMKPSAILINTGRGPLIDEEALAEALKEHRIYAAGVDVLTQEPPKEGSPLIGLDNCFITPHIAWATSAARVRLLNVALDNVQAFLGGQPQNVVN
ncbi:MAG: D-2-hydroxyacid dehydrogenase [Prevotella sp.]|nr:D-2-hydroxyacid dehydrogenase [Prevotella sp.]